MEIKEQVYKKLCKVLEKNDKICTELSKREHEMYATLIKIYNEWEYIVERRRKYE